MSREFSKSFCIQTHTQGSDNNSIIELELLPSKDKLIMVLTRQVRHPKLKTRELCDEKMNATIPCYRLTKKHINLSNQDSHSFQTIPASLSIG